MASTMNNVPFKLINLQQMNCRTLYGVNTESLPFNSHKQSHHVIWSPKNVSIVIMCEWMRHKWRCFFFLQFETCDSFEKLQRWIIAKRRKWLINVNTFLVAFIICKIRDEKIIESVRLVRNVQYSVILLINLSFFLNNKTSTHQISRSH